MEDVYGSPYNYNGTNRQSEPFPDSKPGSYVSASKECHDPDQPDQGAFNYQPKCTCVKGTVCNSSNKPSYQ
jgi:hypothetical protein